MNYLFVYNHTQISFNPTDIHETITNKIGVDDWWHYLPNVYMVSTLKDEQTITDIIIANHPGLMFLVVKVDLRAHNGVLNRSAWDWINKKTRVILKVKPAPPPPKVNLSTLLGYLPTSNPKTTGSDVLDELLGLKKG